MEERTQISLITIPLNHIFHLAQLFCKEKPSRKPKRGHSLTYPSLIVSAIILLILLFYGLCPLSNFYLKA
jgi:uncharacterized membrane protein YecN with MAPEG domain